MTVCVCVFVCVCVGVVVVVPVGLVATNARLLLPGAASLLCMLLAAKVDLFVKQTNTYVSTQLICMYEYACVYVCAFECAYG